MIKVKRSTVLFAIALMLFVQQIPAFATKAKYVTLVELRDETKGGWHQTYTYKGETIQIDADIVIPEIEDVAIVQVRRANDLFPIGEPENANIIQGSDNVGFYSDVESENGVFWGSTMPGVSVGNIISYEKGAQAENSPFSPSDAVDFLYKKLEPYQEKIGHEIQITMMYASTRHYPFQKADRSGATLDFNKPASAMGGYGIYANQVLYGIPLVQLRPFFYNMVKSEPIIGDNEFMGRITMLAASEIDYVLEFYPAIEDKVLVQSVPLASFSSVKAACEKLIETGYIRNVFDISLEYTVMLNPGDVGNTYILLPIWVVSGIVVEDPSHKTPAYTDEEMKDFRENRAIAALINAQTATYIDPHDNSPTRWYGSYITWNEVK